jgi:hypothetical protein
MWTPRVPTPSHQRRTPELQQPAVQSEVFDPTVDGRVKPVSPAIQLEPLKPGEQVTEDCLELEACEVGTHAEVLAHAEGHVGVGAAVHAERKRIPEDLLIAVSRSVEESPYCPKI